MLWVQSVQSVSQSVGWLYFSFISQPYTPNREDKGCCVFWYCELSQSVSQAVGQSLSWLSTFVSQSWIGEEEGKGYCTTSNISFPLTNSLKNLKNSLTSFIHVSNKFPSRRLRITRTYELGHELIHISGKFHVSRRLTLGKFHSFVVSVLQDWRIDLCLFTCVWVCEFQVSLGSVFSTPHKFHNSPDSSWLLLSLLSFVSRVRIVSSELVIVLYLWSVILGFSYWLCVCVFDTVHHPTHSKFSASLYPRLCVFEEGLWRDYPASSPSPASSSSSCNRIPFPTLARLCSEGKKIVNERKIVFVSVWFWLTEQEYWKKRKIRKRYRQKQSKKKTKEKLK